MSNTSKALTELRRLTEAGRLDARDRARDYVLRSYGSKPEREQFNDAHVSKYPASVTVLIVILCLVTLGAAFTPSAIRLYEIGSHTFGQAIPM